ncbi:hypothetical protein TNCV_1804441 [Trichonephila clavipes]|nr:hypothetical protein TNCV_1804441 [Trichonephila clavipes]
MTFRIQCPLSGHSGYYVHSILGTFGILRPFHSRDIRDTTSIPFSGHSGYFVHSRDIRDTMPFQQSGTGQQLMTGVHVESCVGISLSCVERLMYVNLSRLIVLTLASCGSLESGIPTQVSSSSLDHCSELTRSVTYSHRIAL